MIFKVKKRAKTNYYDKIVAVKGTTADTSQQKLENVGNSLVGEDTSITYNWPYDYFSLVELVKLDAKITFADINNDDKGNRTVKQINKASESALQDNGQLDQSDAISVATGNKKGNK